VSIDPERLRMAQQQRPPREERAGVGGIFAGLLVIAFLAGWAASSTLNLILVENLPWP
jgi:type II secretory pathway component PulM